MADTVLGKVSCVPRGDYDAGTAYTALDIVGYSGGSYMALRDVQGVTPGNDGTNWMQLAGPGTPGAQGERGEPGAAAGFGTATVTVDDSTGTPAASVELSGPDTAKVFAFAFSGLKGETGAEGEQGPQGNPGTSVKSIRRTSGTGAAGTTDTYTMYDSEDAPIGTFTVYNGANGEGSGDFMANGTVPMTGSLSMGGNRVTGLGAPQEASDAVRQQDLEVLSDELDAVIAGTTPIAIPVATEAKAGAVKPGSGLEVTADGTLNVTATAQDLGAMPEVSGGTAGQVLTKTTDGQAWQDAPDGLPEGGTTGQILTKTESGAAWADAPETGVVNFNGRTGAVTPQAGDYTADMVGARPDTWTPTADEIGAVPVTRTVNGKPLSGDIALDAADVGARAASWMPTAAQVGAIPAVSGVKGQFLGFTAANTVGAVDAPASGGKRTCRFVVGTSTAGWTDADCDYLCDGTDDQVEINAAIQSLPATGGEIVILDGLYSVGSPVIVSTKTTRVVGNSGTIIKASPSFSGESVVILRSESSSIETLNIDCSYLSISGVSVESNKCLIHKVSGGRVAYSMAGTRFINVKNVDSLRVSGCLYPSYDETRTKYGRFMDSSLGYSPTNMIITENILGKSDLPVIIEVPGVGGVISNNVIIGSGTVISIIGDSFSVSSNFVKSSTTKTGGSLAVKGNKNCVSGNTVLTEQVSIRIMGDYNLVSSNVLGKSQVTDEGSSNTVVNNKVV